MKLVIENRDINDPAEFKEIAPVEVDLNWESEAPAPPQPDFSDLIAEAADNAARQQEEQDKRQRAQTMLADGIKALKDQVARETGHTVGHKDLWVYKRKSKAAYALWRRVIPLFVQDPKTLDLGATALARWLDGNESNYTVTRDMIYDPLNGYAVSDVRRLLKKLAVTLTLKEPVTIRSIQEQLIERRDAALSLTVEEFSGRFVIRGDKVYVNGAPYKIQFGSSGQRRIQYGRRWLQLEVLKDICVATAE